MARNSGVCDVDNWNLQGANGLMFVMCLQSPAVSVTCVDIREMRAGDVHAARAGHRRRRCLLIGIIQRGHPSVRQSGRCLLINNRSRSSLPLFAPDAACQLHQRGQSDYTVGFSDADLLEELVEDV